MAESTASQDILGTCDALKHIIEALFERLTGNTLHLEDNSYCAPYALGGISSECICPKLWLEEALPLLMDRLNTLLEPTANQRNV